MYAINLSPYSKATKHVILTNKLYIKLCISLLYSFLINILNVRNVWCFGPFIDYNPRTGTCTCEFFFQDFSCFLRYYLVRALLTSQLWSTFIMVSLLKPVCEGVYFKKSHCICEHYILGERDAFNIENVSYNCIKKVVESISFDVLVHWRQWNFIII